MADASKLKNRARNNLGSPPGPDEVATSLNSPEIAPTGQIADTAIEQVPLQQEVQAPTEPAEPESAPAVPAATPVSNTMGYIRRDGRSARKTHRIIPFATRVTPEFDNEVRDIAEREDIKLVEVLEQALDAYKKLKGY
ncbi:hypothetical protein [Citrobacter braakii]|uniref:hypothetical protein n=1 Tax=Citrobacter braakii TaxID=57706 RepID=UPI0034E471CC